MGNTHTTTDGDVVTDNLVVLNNSNPSDVVGEDIDTIVWRDGNGHLELSWQVGRAVHWLEVGDLTTSDLLLVQPDLVVSGSSGQQVLGQGDREVVDSLVRLGHGRVDGTLNVSV